MENENSVISKVDVRIIVSGLDIAEVVSKSVDNTQLERDYNIIVSSIIPTNNFEIAKKVANGGDIILIGGYGQDENYNLLFNDLKTDFNLQLVAAIPHIDQHKKWNAEYQTRYFEILSCYDIVYIVRDKYTKDCFQKRNEWMVDNSQYVIGVYDDSISSGSKNCINYAKKQHRIISIINTN